MNGVADHCVLDRSGCSPSLRSERRRRSDVTVRFHQVLHVELAARQLAVDVVVVVNITVHLLCVAANVLHCAAQSELGCRS